jgi:hypothetical protein
MVVRRQAIHHIDFSKSLQEINMEQPVLVGLDAKVMSHRDEAGLRSCWFDFGVESASSSGFSASKCKENGCCTKINADAGTVSNMNKVDSVVIPTYTGRSIPSLFLLLNVTPAILITQGFLTQAASWTTFVDPRQTNFIPKYFKTVHL